MKKTGLGFLVVACLASGCVAERSCPEGERLEGDVCVPIGGDGGPGGDAGPDADAPGSCAAPCTGDLPFCVDGACVACAADTDCDGVCVDGACVACRDDAGCGPMAPHCDAGSCVSCEGRSCPADVIARELEALVCWGAGGAVRSSSAGDDVAQRRLEEDAITALVCSYPSSVPVVGQILEAVRDGRTTVNFAALRTCMEAVQRLSSSATLLSLLFCEGALIGSQTNGGACVGDFDCASSFCMPATSGCIGVCAAQVAVGQPCVADSQCAGAASCAGSVCVADGPSTGAARGESCTYDYQCASPLVCIEATSTCEDVPGDGMPCHDSVLFDCAEGTYCVAGVCRLRSEEGERCPDQVSCVAGTQCAGSPSRCLPVAVNGEACDASVVCAVGTTCTDGTCQAWPDLGEPCSDVCYRGVCEEGTCVSDRVGRDCSPGLRPFDALDPCGAGATCASGSGGEWYCVATVAAGEACGGDDRCDEPSETCSERDVCEALCSL